MGFPGTDADTGASAARGCNALLMNTKNFIKDCLYIKLSTKLCPITPVAPFHAWKLLAAATVRHCLLHLPILHDSVRFLDRIEFSSSTFRSWSFRFDIEEIVSTTNRSRNVTEKRRDRRSIRLGRVNYFATFKTYKRVYIYIYVYTYIDVG